MINFSGQFRGPGRAGIAIAAAIVLGCGGGTAGTGDRLLASTAPDRLWVVAPHPDDEVLMAGALLRDAVTEGRPRTVIVMTNGDLSCTRDGHARQIETITALAELGVDERDVHFLGYPDGWLDALGPVPLDPLPRTQADGTCGVGDRTYASHGDGGLDVHTLRTGSPGPYVASGPTEDLVWLLERERPSEIVTTHGIDTHPDHAMTYAYVRRALDRAAIPRPRLLRSLVHQGPCWPNGTGLPPCPDVRLTQGTAFPALAPPLDRYEATLRMPGHEVLVRAAIAHYTTQLESSAPEESWLSSFARSDAPFWEAPEERGDVADVRAAFDPGGTLALAPVELVVDATGATLRSGDTVLRRLPVPHGEDTTVLHAWRLRVVPVASGDLVEIEVSRDDEFWMLAIVPAAQPLSVASPQSALSSRSR